jgi:hypothetical protein
MCANCVSRFDVIVGTIGFGAYVFKEPLREGLVAAGVLPEAHPLASDMRTVTFLRDLDLDPVEILGRQVTERADRALAFEPRKVYRRSFRDALAFFVGRSMWSQRTPATQNTR